MKVLLLNDGGYEALKNVSFPVIVEGCADTKRDWLARVPAINLLKIGADSDCLDKVWDVSFYISDSPHSVEAIILNEVLTSVRTPSGLFGANVGYTVSGKEISVHTIESVGGTDLIDEVDGASMLLLKISLAAIEESK